MGRRSVVDSRAIALQRRLGQELAKLNLVNKVAFQAQRYEEECVALVRDMAFSNEAPWDHRLRCAQQVVEWARGRVREWNHDGRTIGAEEQSPAGGTIMETIDAARVTADLFGRLDDLVRRQVPYRDWPEDIKGLAEAAAFAEMEGATYTEEATVG